MALSSQHVQRLLLHGIICSHVFTRNTRKSQSLTVKGGGGGGTKSCSAIAIDSPSSVINYEGIRWGSAQLQGPREEMEDDVVIVQPDNLKGFSYAAVFDGHAGFSSVQFLRDELYNDCAAALQGGLVLNGKDLKAIRTAFEKAFESADSRLLSWLEANRQDVESGSTATVIFIGNDTLFISHVGDSSVVLSRSEKAEELTNSHRPYGSSKVSLQEIRRIREAGGWIVDGRICGDISVSRAFGDMRFKIKKDEMLAKGVAEGRWTEKFASRIQFRGDLVAATPDVLQISLGPDAEFVLLASDGLWDYVKSSDAVAFVRNQLREHGDVQVACEALARMALANGLAKFASAATECCIRVGSSTSYNGCRIIRNIYIISIVVVIEVSLYIHYRNKQTKLRSFFVGCIVCFA